LGADEVIDYRTEDVFKRAQEIAGPRLFDGIIDTIGPRNGVDNLRLLAPEGGVAFIAGIPDLSAVNDLPYSIAIHDIGLGGVLVAPQFRRQQEDLAKMAAEMIRLMERGEIRSTVSNIVSLNEIPQSLATLAEGHVRGKIVARLVQ
jgi:NADPH:quinone reductase